MSSVARSLLADERVLATAGRHWLVPLRESLLPAGLVIAGLVLLVLVPPATGPLGFLWTLLGWGGWLLLLGGAGWIAWNVAAWRTTEVVVTTLRILRHEGVLRRRVIEVSLAGVADVQLEQGLVGRQLGYGDLRIIPVSGRPPVGAIVAVTRPAALRNAVLAVKLGRPLEGIAAGAGPGAGGSGPGAGPARGAIPGWGSGGQPQGATLGMPPPVPPPPPGGAPSARAVPGPRSGPAAEVARLERLAELLDRGLITPAEFEAKKSEILRRL